MSRARKANLDRGILVGFKFGPQQVRIDLADVDAMLTGGAS